MRKRYLTEAVRSIAFADHKMAFISGPRQCGKTTLAKMLLKKTSVGRYYNWDDIEFRRLWVKNPKMAMPDRNGSEVPLIVFDEIHKAKGWKRALKGLFDTLKNPADILVIGSARLNIYKKGGDSLLGRYYHFRLHPFSLAELLGNSPNLPDNFIAQVFQGVDRPCNEAREYLKDLMLFGGFPEQVLKRDAKKARLWRQNRVEMIIREDLRDLSRIPELSQIEMLASLLPERVGSPLSINSLREDLEVNFDTVKRWLLLLADLYYLFRIQPYSRSVKRSLKKESKLYLWDYSEVDSKGARLENLIACHLLKACHYWTDTGEGLFELCYLRNKEKQEIDFLITRDKAPWLPIEVKSQKKQPTPAWKKFLPMLPCNQGLQLVLPDGVYENYEMVGGNVVVTSVANVLSKLV